MKSICTCALLAVAAMSFVGCASQHEEGVKSDYRSQWTMVNADTMTTTDAAKAVLADKGLMEVDGKADKMVGKAMGKMADKTMVNVAVKKETDMTSQVSVTIGMMGDPKNGAEIAKAIKMKAEGMPKMDMPKTDMPKMDMPEKKM